MSERKDDLKEMINYFDSQINVLVYDEKEEIYVDPDKPLYKYDVKDLKIWDTSKKCIEQRVEMRKMAVKIKDLEKRIINGGEGAR